MRTYKVRYQDPSNRVGYVFTKRVKAEDYIAAQAKIINSSYYAAIVSCEEVL